TNTHFDGWDGVARDEREAVFTEARKVKSAALTRGFLVSGSVTKEGNDGVVLHEWDRHGLDPRFSRDDGSIVEASALVEIGERPFLIPFRVPGPAPIVVGMCVFGIESDRLAEIGDGLFVILLAVPGATASTESVRGLWTKPNRLGVIGERLVKVP